MPNWPCHAATQYPVDVAESSTVTYTSNLFAEVRTSAGAAIVVAPPQYPASHCGWPHKESFGRRAQSAGESLCTHQRHAVMVECWDSSEIDDASKRCAVKAGFDGKVWPAESDSGDRDTLCSTKECVEFYLEFQYQRDQGCGIANAFSSTPFKDGLRDGRHDSRFCDYSLAAPTGTPATTLPETPKPTIVPATSKPVPVPATPAPTTAPVTAKPTSTTSTPASTAPLSLVSITTPPPTASATVLVTSTGMSTGAAAAIGGCAVAAVVALIGFIVLCCRRSRESRIESKQHLPSPHGEGISAEFSEFPTPRTTLDAASISNTTLWMHPSITTNRIPLAKVQVSSST